MFEGSITTDDVTIVFFSVFLEYGKIVGLLGHGITFLIWADNVI